MNKTLLAPIGALALALLAPSVQAQMSAEDMIKTRQSGYTFMAWNMSKIKAQVVDGTVPYDKAQVLAAANLIAATANSGMGALFRPGTEQGTGWKPTRVKANFFQEPDEVRRIAMHYIGQANKLQEVAATGDTAAIKAQFGELGQACKACHDKYRAEE